MISLPRTLCPFPNPIDVFAGTPDDIKQAAHLLLPLLTVDLQEFDPTFSGKIHILSPIEPVECILGEGSDEFHSRYIREDWIGFRLVAGNKYEFLGDWRYFHANNPQHPLHGSSELTNLYADAHASYTARKKQYEQTRSFTAENGRELQFLTQWAGLPPHGNWEGNDSIPRDCVEVNDKGDAVYYPMTEDGRRFIFIASVDAANYCDWTWKEVLTFYDPKEKIVLFTFEYS